MLICHVALLQVTQYTASAFNLANSLQFNPSSLLPPQYFLTVAYRSNAIIAINRPYNTIRITLATKRHPLCPCRENFQFLPRFAPPPAEQPSIHTLPRASVSPYQSTGHMRWSQSGSLSSGMRCEIRVWWRGRQYTSEGRVLGLCHGDVVQALQATVSGSEI